MRDDTGWTRAQALAQRLAERVAAFWTGGVREEVLDPAAVAEADELRAFFLRAPSPPHPTPDTANRPLYVLDRSVLATIAALHYARCSLLGPDTPEGRPEAQLTLMLYAVLGRFAPGEVPEQLRETVASVDVPPVEDLEAAAVRALELFGRWQAAGDGTALETAISLWRDMADLLPAPWPGRPMVLSNLCSGLRFRYLVRGGEADLEESVALGREAVRLAAPDDPSRAMYLANLSGSLSVRYELRRDPGDLDLAVDTGRDSVRAAPVPQALFHSNAGFALLLRHDRNTAYDDRGAADADLDAAVEEFRAAVRHAPADDPQRPMYLANLGHALHQRFRRHGRPADLETGVDAATRAVTDCPPGHPARHGHLLRLSGILRSRAELTGASADLDTAVDTARQALAAAPAASPDRQAATEALGLALRLRFERLRQQADLDESGGLLPEPSRDEGVPAATTPSATTPTASPAGPVPLALPDSPGLATMELRFGDPGDFGGAPDVQAFPEPGSPSTAEVPADLAAPSAAGVAPDPGHPSDAQTSAHLPAPPPDPAERHHAEQHHDEARDLLARFRDVGDPADLDGAIEAARQGTALSLLGEALYARAVRTGSGADLDEAIGVLDEVLRTGPDSAERIVDESRLGSALLRRYGRTGDPDDLARAVDFNRRAAERITDDSDPYAHQLLFNLGRTLQAVYEQSDDLDALDEAVRRLEGALRAGPAPGTGDPKTLSKLGALLRVRAGRLGGRGDLDRAVEVSRQAATALPDGHPRRAAYLSGLGAALLQRYLSYGTRQDLDEAVRVCRESADATPAEDTAARATRLADLATALRRRYECAGALDDLDAAIEAYRSAQAAPPDSHADTAAHRTGLAVALLARHRRTRTAADLDDAIDSARAAADALSDEHPLRALCLANLALALRHRHQAEGRRSDADEAVARLRTAVRLTPEGHPQRPVHQSNLALALIARCAGGDPTANRPSSPSPAGPAPTDAEDATEAAHAARAALRALPEGHPHRAACLTNLGAALVIRSRTGGDEGDARTAGADDVRPANEDDLRTACEAFRRATRIAAAPASIRFRAARARATAAVTLQDWAEALDAHRAALAELPLPAWHGLDHGDRLPTPDGTTELARDAAAVALNAGHPQEALCLLERGRGVLLAQTPETLEAPESLADRIHETRSLLETPGPEADPMTAADPARLRREQRAAAEQRHELARELEELVARARELPGLGDFLRPPSPESLRAAAAHGPVVVVNTSALRCDAIIVTRTGLRTVPLPDLRLHGEDGLLERSTALREALSPTAGSPPSAWRTQRLLTRTLAWLWDTVAAPVLATLDPAETGPRLWWCPTGPLTHLPLHAAGHYGPADAETKRALPDHYVCSYTPTVRALATHTSTEHAGATDAVVTQWTVDEESAQELSNAFEAALAETTKDTAHALHKAVQHLRRNKPDPLRWAAYAHTGP